MTTFFCHNSKDKTFVLDAFQALHLASDATVFLDLSNIALGAQWRAEVECALSTCTSGLIFLGGAGWGSTHFEEANVLHARASRDNTFVLIPIVLSGFQAEIGALLADGRFFAETAAVDLRNAALSQELIEKLRATLHGQSYEPGNLRGAELTIHVLRREASRFAQGDHGALTRFGRARLRRARDLQLVQGAAARTEEIGRFLKAVERRIRNQYLLLILILLCLVAALSVLLYQNEQRRRSTLAQQLGAESRLARSADVSLLLSVQGSLIQPSLTSETMVLERLLAFPMLRKWHQFGDGISALHAPSEDVLWVGSWRGQIWRWYWRDEQPSLRNSPTAGAILDISISDTGNLWLALEDGRVMHCSLEQDESRQSAECGWQNVNGIKPLNATPRTLNDPSPMRVIDSCAAHVVAASHAGQVYLIDETQPTRIAWTYALTGQATALAFAPDCKTVYAASNDGLIVALSTATGEAIATFTTADSGFAMALQARKQSLRVFDQGGKLRWRQAPLAGSVTAENAGADSGVQHDPDFLSAAALGPKHLNAPLRVADRLLLGYGNGDVNFNVDLTEPERVALPRRVHSTNVSSATLTPSANVGFTGAAEGSVAVFDFVDPSGVPQRVAPASGEIFALAFAGSDLLSISASANDVFLSRNVGKGWIETLLPSSEIPEHVTDAAGFQAVNGSALIAAKLRSNDAIWIDQSGQVRLNHLSKVQDIIALDANESADVDIDEKGSRFAITQGRQLYIGKSNRPLISIQLPLPSRQIAISSSQVIINLENGQVAFVDFAGNTQITPSSLQALSAIASIESDALIAGVGTAGPEIVRVDRNGHVVRFHHRALAVGIKTIAVDPKYRFIAAGDFDGQIHLLDPKTYLTIAILPLLDSMVQTIAISVDGSELVASDTDGSVRKLKLDATAWRASACKIVQRDLSKEEWQPFGEDVSKPVCLAGSPAAH